MNFPVGRDLPLGALLLIFYGLLPSTLAFAGASAEVCEVGVVDDVTRHMRQLREARAKARGEVLPPSHEAAAPLNVRRTDAELERIASEARAAKRTDEAADQGLVPPEVTRFKGFVSERRLEAEAQEAARLEKQRIVEEARAAEVKTIEEAKRAEVAKAENAKAAEERLPAVTVKAAENAPEEAKAQTVARRTEPALTKARETDGIYHGAAKVEGRQPRIGIFAADFDHPPNAGHWEAVKAAVAELKLDQVIIIPGHGVENRSGLQAAAAFDRDLVGRNFHDIPQARVLSTGAESKLAGKTYSEVLNDFATKNPGHSIVGLAGDDLLKGANLRELLPASKNPNVHYALVGTKSADGENYLGVAAKSLPGDNSIPKFVTVNAEAVPKGAIERALNAGEVPERHLRPGVAEQLQKTFDEGKSYAEARQGPKRGLASVEEGAAHEPVRPRDVVSRAVDSGEGSLNRAAARDPLAGIRVQPGYSESEIQQALRLRSMYQGNIPAALVSAEKRADFLQRATDLRALESQIYDATHKGGIGFLGSGLINQQILVERALSSAKAMFEEMGYKVQVKLVESADMASRTLDKSYLRKVLVITGVPANDKMLTRYLELDRTAKVLSRGSESKPLMFVYNPAMKSRGELDPIMNRIRMRNFLPDLGKTHDPVFIHELMHDEANRYAILRQALGSESAHIEDPAIRANLGVLKNKNIELYRAEAVFGTLPGFDKAGSYSRNLSMEELRNFDLMLKQMDAQVRDAKFITERLGADALPLSLRRSVSPETVAAYKKAYIEMSSQMSHAYAEAHEFMSGNRKDADMGARFFQNPGQPTMARLEMKMPETGELMKLTIPMYGSKGLRDPENSNILKDLVSRSAKLTEWHEGEANRLLAEGTPVRKLAAAVSPETAIARDVAAIREVLALPESRAHITMKSGDGKWEREAAWLRDNSAMTDEFSRSTAAHPRQELLNIAKQNGLELNDSKWEAVRRARASAPGEILVTDGDEVARNGRILAAAGMGEDEIRKCRALGICAKVPETAELAARIDREAVRPSQVVSRAANDGQKSLSAAAARVEEVVAGEKSGYRVAPKGYRGMVIMSTDSIEANKAELLFRNPALAGWLTEYGDFGHYLSSGANSPMGGRGPGGNSVFKPGHYVSGSDWHETAELLNANGGALGKDGVFGDRSILSNRNYRELLPAEFREGGVLMFDGPKGPKGPYSSLDSAGAHGFPVNENGEFFNPKTGKIVKSVKVEEEGGAAMRDLVEDYVPSFAKSHDLQGSFRVSDELKPGESVTYSYTGKKDHWTNMVPVPDTVFDRFSIEVLSKEGDVLAKGTSDKLVNFAIPRFSEDSQVQIRITNMGRERRGGLDMLNPFDPRNYDPFNVQATNRFHFRAIEVPADPTIKAIEGSHLTRFVAESEMPGAAGIAKGRALASAREEAKAARSGDVVSRAVEARESFSDAVQGLRGARNEGELDKQITEVARVFKPEELQHLIVENHVRWNQKKDLWEYVLKEKDGYVLRTASSKEEATRVVIEHYLDPINYQSIIDHSRLVREQGRNILAENGVRQKFGDVFHSLNKSATDRDVDLFLRIKKTETLKNRTFYLTENLEAGKFDPNAFGDLLGARLTTKNWSDVENVKAQISATFKDYHPEFREIVQDQYGYKAVHITLTDPKSAVKFEAQVMTKDMHAFDKWSGRKYYRLDPSIPRTKEQLALQEYGREVGRYLTSVSEGRASRDLGQLEALAAKHNIPKVDQFENSPFFKRVAGNWDRSSSEGRALASAREEAKAARTGDVVSRAVEAHETLASMMIKPRAESSQAEIETALRLRAKYMGNTPLEIRSTEKYADIVKQSRELNELEAKLNKIVHEKPGYFSAAAKEQARLHDEALAKAKTLFESLGYKVRESSARRVDEGNRVLLVEAIPAHDRMLTNYAARERRFLAAVQPQNNKSLIFAYSPGLGWGSGAFNQELKTIVNRRLRPSLGGAADLTMPHELMHYDTYRYLMLRSKYGEDFAKAEAEVGDSARILRKGDNETYAGLMFHPGVRLVDKKGGPLPYGEFVAIDELQTYERTVKQAFAKQRDEAFIEKHLGKDALPLRLSGETVMKKFDDIREIYQEVASRINTVYRDIEAKFADDKFKSGQITFEVLGKDQPVTAKIHLYDTFSKQPPGMLQRPEVLLEVPLFESTGPKDPNNARLLREYIARSQEIIDYHVADSKALKAAPLSEVVVKTLEPPGVAIGRETTELLRVLDSRVNSAEIRASAPAENGIVSARRAWLEENGRRLEAWDTNPQTLPTSVIATAKNNGLELSGYQWLAVRRARESSPIEMMTVARDQPQFLKNSQILAEAGMSDQQIHTCRALGFCAKVPDQAVFNQRVESASAATVARARATIVSRGQVFYTDHQLELLRISEDQTSRGLYEAVQLRTARAAEASDVRRTKLLESSNPVERLTLLREEEKFMAGRVNLARLELAAHASQDQEENLYRLEREHAAINSRYLAESRARLEALGSDQNSATRDLTAAVNGREEALQPFLEKLYPGESLEGALADSAKEKVLRDAFKKELIAEAGFHRDAQQELERAIQTHIPGAFDPDRAKKMAHELVEANANPKALNASTAAEREQVVAAELAQKWSPDQLRACKEMGICAPSLEARPAAVVEKELSADAREILAEHALQMPGAKRVEAARALSGLPGEKKFATVEEALRDLKARELKISDEVKAKGLLANSSPEDAAIQQALADAKRAETLIHDQIKTLDAESGVLQRMASRSAAESSQANRASGAVLQFLRNPESLAVLKSLDKRLSIYAKRAALGKEDSIAIYRDFKQMVKTLESPGLKAKVLEAIEADATRRSGVFAKALRSEPKLSEGQLVKSIEKADGVALATGSAKLTGNSVRAELGSAREALASALGVIKGEESPAGRAAELRAARIKVQEEAASLMAKEAREAKAEGRGLASVESKSPQELLNAAERDLKKIDGFDDAPREALTSAMAKAMERGESLEVTRAHLAHLEALAGNNPDMFEAYRLAYGHAVEELGENKKWDEAWEQGVKKMMEESGYSKEAAEAKFKSTARCLKI